MTEASRRVVLLARPGPACERLSAALQDAGAELVLTADPLNVEAQSIAAAQAQAILVALEPAVEDVLDRFDAVLGDPEVMVIFEEADLAAQREGWDAARWVRHLSAKLHRHGDVLPPGAEAEPDPASQDLGALLANEAMTRAAGVPRDATTRGVRVGDADSQDAVARTHPVADPGFIEMTDASASREDASAEQETSASRQRFQQDLEDLDRRIADITLADARSYGHGPQRGAVLVEGGMGGPDAVRQLLGAMPAQFPRPVLVRLRLDGGRYDRLVRQMARATALSVLLAEPGQAAEGGKVYFMAPTLALAEEGSGLVFIEAGDGAGSVLASLPAGDSAVVLLSGSDPSLVDAAMTHSWSGALVLGQSADGCYDAAASNALVARGAEAGAPAELARRLAERWPT